MKLPLINQDKANHFIYGFIIYFLTNLFLNPYYSIGIVFIFALWKEIKDEKKYGGFDWEDFLTTIIPSIAMVLKFTFIK